MFKEPDILIVKLEAHLKHIETIRYGRTFRSLLHHERMAAIYDEVKLMLAMIEGAKEF